MILHGHGHRNRLTHYYGIPGVMGRSSLRAKKEVGGYTIAEVTSDSIYFKERTPAAKTSEDWAKLPLLHPVYSIAVDEITRPDYTVNDSFPDVRPDWIFESYNLMAASPVVSGNTAFVGDAAGKMYALSLEDGAVRLQFKAGHKIYGSAAVQQNRLVFPCTDGMIYCLKTENGDLQWKHQTMRPNLAVPVIEKGVVYIGGSDGTFRAIDLDSGKLLWKFEGVKGYVESKPFIYADKVIFTAWDQTVYALDKKDGSLLWTWADGRQHLLYSPAACWPVVANGKVFITAPDRFMSAIDAESGKTVWRTNVFKVRETLGISEDGTMVYGQCMWDTVFAVDTRSKDFDPLWVQNFKYGYDIAPSMLQSIAGRVFFGTKNGLIIAFDEISGTLHWKHKFGNTLINTVTPLDGNRLLISNMDGQVALLKDFSFFSIHMLNKPGFLK